jgi:hypothetical protein
MLTGGGNLDIREVLLDGNSKLSGKKGTSGSLSLLSGDVANLCPISNNS